MQETSDRKTEEGGPGSLAGWLRFLKETTALPPTRQLDGVGVRRVLKKARCQREQPGQSRGAAARCKRSRTASPTLASLDPRASGITDTTTSTPCSSKVRSAA